jgi:undecaprenyl diphosphate synthase
MRNIPNCAVENGGSVFLCYTMSYTIAVVQFLQSLIVRLIPILIGLFIGIWLGTTQLRQQKSYTTIIITWFTSIAAMMKLLLRMVLGTTTTATHTTASSTTTNQRKSGDSTASSSQQNGSTESVVLVKNYVDTPVESGCELQYVPQHVAIIMDGNRRYGKRMYGVGTMGHFDGGQKLLQVIEWLETEGVKAMTLYAFSTENWNRESTEIEVLMGIFQHFVEVDLRPIVLNRKVRVRHICTDTSNMPPKLHAAIRQLEDESVPNATPNSLTLNVCLSYGSRGEIVQACQSLATDCVAGTIRVDNINEEMVSQRLLTSHSPDPDVLIRTSGEERISNFLLWQLSYTELFFLEKDWPELEKEDFLKVIRTFAQGRQRRFGK